MSVTSSVMNLTAVLLNIVMERGVSAALVKSHIVTLCLRFGIEPVSGIKLAIYLNCELFRMGLRALGHL